jgi:coenzyme F420-reducing hydrogenase beta subunit
MQFDKYGELKPNGPRSWMRKRSEAFTKTCPFSPSAIKENTIATDLYCDAEQSSAYLGKFQKAYVGHVEEEDFRTRGSSGGMVTWVATELMRKGLIDGVAHVVATDDPKHEGRYFKYRISKTEDHVRGGAKSRYYPIELSDIIEMIRTTPGRYAIIGIPCFIKAVHLLRHKDPVLQERIKFTLGLFCGHMKSARFVESFAWQMNVRVEDVLKVEYRYKDTNRPANLYNAMLTMRDGSVVNRDWWHLVDGDWGAGFFMNSACNFCDDVVSETADVAFGDAWVEPYSSDGRGTNVVIARSTLVTELIDAAISEGRLNLKTVDAAFVEQTQAAGFRQRREGLAYRLTWAWDNIRPYKRVAPNARNISRQRKLIYRMRYYISAWSHRIFWLAKKMNKPNLYIGWAKLAAATYHGLAYHKGKVGEMVMRLAAFK